MYRRQPLRWSRSARTWAEAFRELADIQARADQFFAQWEPQIAEAITSAGCCVMIAEVLRGFRQRAWARAVSECERGVLSHNKQKQPKKKQLELFGG